MMLFLNLIVTSILVCATVSLSFEIHTFSSRCNHSIITGIKSDSKYNYNTYVFPKTKRTNNANISLLSKNDDETDQYDTTTQTTIPDEFDSLENVLDRARKRKMIMLPYQIQAITSKSLIPLNTKRTINLNVGETILILIGIKLGSYGFGLGYTIGKASQNWARVKLGSGNLLLAELWTVSLAISMDVICNNLF